MKKRTVPIRRSMAFPLRKRRQCFTMMMLFSNTTKRTLWMKSGSLCLEWAKQIVCWLFVTAAVREACCVSYLHARQPEERKVSIGSVFRRDTMKEEYDFSDAIKNPYSKQLKKQITININNETVAYFKAQSEEVGIPYQTLINLYLSDCAAHGRKLNLSWQ